MAEWLNQVWQEIVARPSGPFAFRFYMQPAMAVFFAIRDGMRDARAGKDPYFWQLFYHPERRRELLRAGWKSVGRIFILAVILDVVYGLVVLHAIRPLQTLFVATTLALLPYILLRGPVNRIAKAVRRRPPDASKVA